jgi:hypothetical protein
MLVNEQPKWCTQRAECDTCGHAWVAVVPIRALGKECPACGFYDPEFVWFGLVYLARESFANFLTEMFGQGGKG